MSRGDPAEAEWRPLKELLPAERGRKSRPAFDNRPIVKGILWCIRTGAPWRDLRLGPPALLHDKLVPDAGQ